MVLADLKGFRSADDGTTKTWLQTEQYRIHIIIPFDFYKIKDTYQNR